MPDPSHRPVTFLFTDIEGSTRLWETDAARMSEALARHDLISRAAIEACGGRFVKTTGDGVHAAFADAVAATAAAVELQQGVAAIADDCGLPLRIRCGLHSGLSDERDGDYFGSTVNRAARIMSAAHGGQVLLSKSVVDQVAHSLPGDSGLLHLGRVRLRDLAAPEDLWQLLHADLERTFPVLRSLDSTPNNLPLQTTVLFGRERELAEVRALIGRTRLLTLTGSGGCGKTRLMLHLAADTLEAFPDGVWMVELASLADAALVPQSTASVLGLKEELGKPIAQTLAGYLKDKTLLLLLDNCEHLLDGCARLAADLLRRCANVRILASSREALAISGEQTYRVPSLSFPDREKACTAKSLLPFEAAQLFADRARLVRSDFIVTDRTAPAIASICHRLDGIPLALELAAARVRTLPVEEIEARLDQRFRLLTGGSRTALPRQQTLRSLIDWSYDLLAASEQAMLCALSVFAGGWSLEAAERVCEGDGPGREGVLDLLAALSDKSLVLAEERGGAVRYRMLETVRQYARDRLLERGEGEALRNRHLACFLSLAKEAEPRLRGAQQQDWLDRLEADHDNLRGALSWSAAAKGDAAVAGVELAASLFQFWYVRGYIREASARYAELLASGANLSAQVRAKALGAAGVMLWQQGENAAARRCHEECLAIEQAAGDRARIARTLINLGLVEFNDGRYGAARTRFEEGLALRREQGNLQGVAGVLHNLAAVASAVGDGGDARRLFEESLAIYRELGDRWGVAMSLSNLGALAVETEPDAAQALFDESLVLRRELGDRRGVAESLEGLGSVAFMLSRLERAGRLWGAALRARDELGAPLTPTEQRQHDARVASARAAGGDAFEQAWREGARMTLERAVDCALARNADA